MTDEYRDAIANLATAVSIITTKVDGKPVGMTASAVCSLSLEPMLLLVCINARLPTHEAIERAGRFAVNVLPEGCERLATHFARPAPDKFADVRLVEGHDLPLLRDALAYFVCDLHERLPGGDHSIFIGLVRRCERRTGGKPLLYFNRKFGRLDNPEEELMRALAQHW
jgi:3-hydroxy-9,10-secoandrosta-1,3,5(10)-triene-9,17-dione monooxygenase reductase component